MIEALEGALDEVIANADWELKKNPSSWTASPKHALAPSSSICSVLYTYTSNLLPDHVIIWASGKYWPYVAQLS